MRRYSPPGPVAIDDMTGFKVPLRRLKKQWDGALTVEPDKRNPQDFIRARSVNIALQDPRPETADVFTATSIDTEDGIPIMSENGFAIMTEGPLNGAGI